MLEREVHVGEQVLGRLLKQLGSPREPVLQGGWYLVERTGMFPTIAVLSRHRDTHGVVL
jgi:hypothetical protein